MRINDRIRAHQVRLIDQDGEQVGIVSLDDALGRAYDAGLDLVEISPTSDPPVCRVMNYGKYKFEQSKKLKDAKSKQKQIQVKEIKFKPRIDEHDFQFKLNHIRRFIEHGDKVRVFVHFRGREMTHREIGLRLLERTLEELQEIAVVEKRPGMEGNQMAMYLVAKEPAVKSKKAQANSSD